MAKFEKGFKDINTTGKFCFILLNHLQSYLTGFFIQNKLQYIYIYIYIYIIPNSTNCSKHHSISVLNRYTLVVMYDMIERRKVLPYSCIL